MQGARGAQPPGCNDVGGTAASKGNPSFQFSELYKPSLPNCTIWPFLLISFNNSQIRIFDFPKALQRFRPGSIPEGCALWIRCTLGACTPEALCPLGAASPNPCAWRLPPQTLQWRRYLIPMFHPLNHNQVAEPVQGFGAAASHCNGLAAQPPRFRVFEERSPPRSREAWEGAAPRDAARSGDLQRPRDVQVFNSGGCISFFSNFTTWPCLF